MSTTFAFLDLRLPLDLRDEAFPASLLPLTDDVSLISKSQLLVVRDSVVS